MNPNVTITIVAVLSTLSDYGTTRIALKYYPELYEANPHVDFAKEFFFAETGGVGLYSLGKVLKQGKDVSLVFGLVPAVVPFGVAINNLAQIAYAHGRNYPWEECPILFPEEHIS